MRNRLRIKTVALFAVFCWLGDYATGSAGSTSPASVEYGALQMAAQSEAMITFSEFPVATYITDQYAALGIVFAGDEPYITTDGANPTSPVLSGTPQFGGDIEGIFVSPYDGVTPARVNWFSLDAGYFDELESTLLEWFDAGGNKLGQAYNSQTGIETFYVEAEGIARWRISLATQDPAGYAIDNISFGTPSVVRFTKEDDTGGNCRSPLDEITYTICWSNIDGPAIEDAYIIDWLPAGVSYPPGEWTFGFDPNASPPIVLYPPDPGYDAATHTYAWALGSIDPNASGCVQLTVTLNDGAEPGRYLTNIAELWTQSRVVALAMVDTLVCCWDTNGILYVDKEAQGANSGVSWQDAYVDLQSALLRARTTQCAESYVIYVAEGTYSPGDDETDTYEVPDGVYVYGGFKTGGCTFEERNPKRYETILTGRIDETTRNDTIVTMGHETLLDGFVVTESSVLGQGIYSSAVNFAVENCTIEQNYGYGIRAASGNVSLKWCNIRGNGFDGIRHEGQGFVLQVENCWIRQSGQYGIQCVNSTPLVRNSIVSESDMSEFGNEGMRMVNPTYAPILHNITLSHNTGPAIFFIDNGAVGDPNGRDWPDAHNLIVWYNNNGGEQFVGLGRAHFNYSCIYDPNDPYGEDLSLDDNYNFSARPEFAYSDPNNMRIVFGSPCRDSGNPWLNYEGQVEMDRKDRVYGLVVDRGAYEVTCEDISNEWDWNADGIVNLHEFARLAAVWGAHDPNDPGITDPNDPAPEALALWYPEGHKYNFANTGESQYRIDLADLAVLLDEAPWLWIACWRYEEVMQGMMSGQGDQMQMMVGEGQFVEIESVDSRMKSMVNIIVKLQDLWLTDPDIQQEIDSSDWQQFMGDIYTELAELYLSIIEQ